MARITKDEVKEMRKQMLTEMEQRLHDTWSSEEDSLFYYHPSEDRIVLSHALFWVMTRKMADGRSKMSDVRTFMVHGSWFMVHGEWFLLGNEYE